MAMKEKLADALELPKETLLHRSRITVMGKSEVTVENFKGIVSYEDTAVRLKTGDGMLEVRGQKLEIGTITDEEMIIKGSILAMEWV